MKNKKLTNVWLGIAVVPLVAFPITLAAACSTSDNKDIENINADKEKFKSFDQVLSSSYPLIEDGATTAIILEDIPGHKPMPDSTSEVSRSFGIVTDEANGIATVTITFTSGDKNGTTTYIISGFANSEKWFKNLPHETTVDYSDVVDVASTGMSFTQEIADEIFGENVFTVINPSDLHITTTSSNANNNLQVDLVFTDSSLDAPNVVYTHIIFTNKDDIEDAREAVVEQEFLEMGNGVYSYKKEFSLQGFDFFEVRIPDGGFTYIGDNKFVGEAITSLDLSEFTSLTDIGDFAFNDAQLTSLDLSRLSLLKTIGGDAFATSPLTSLDLSGLSLLETIGNGAFRETPLTSLNLSGLSLLKTIGNSAFRDSSLTSLDLSGLSSLESIGSYAFHLSPLTSLNLSGLSALIHIKNNAFTTSQLTSLDLSGLSALAYIDSFAFLFSPLTSLNLSGLSALDFIGNSAFRDSSLTSLDLSGLSSLTAIHNYVFQHSEISSIILPPNTFSVNVDFAFESATEQIKQYIRDHTNPSA